MATETGSVSSREYFAARVVAAWDETPELRGLRLDLGPVGRLHRAPGQVVKLRSPSGQHKDSYFALANAPTGDGQVELLLKRGGPLADEIIAAADGGLPLRATAPLGDGFPVERARGHDVLLFAAGSGITPVRALLQHFLRARAEVGRITLYYGQRNERDFAYVAEHEGWRSAGVHLVLCASQPSHQWGGARGYVQTVAQELTRHELSLDRAVAFVCGMQGMVDDVRGALVSWGLPADRLFVNY